MRRGSIHCRSSNRTSRPDNIYRIVPLTLIFLCFVGCGARGYGADFSEVEKPTYYVVEQGDTLVSISERHGVDSQRLMLMNGFRGSAQLQPGQRILLGYLKGSASSLTRSARNKRNTASNAARRVQPSSLPAPPGDARLSWPLAEGRLVSRFGPRGRSFHDGLDIAAPKGTPIYAAHDGVVVYSGSELGGYGRLLIIRGANDGLYTLYAHNSRLRVQQGSTVRRGERIADVGSTGHSSGPHLHFEVRLRDSRKRMVAVDPLPLLKSNAQVKPRFRVNESLTPLLAR